MWKELLTFVLFYGIALAAHTTHARWQAWHARRKAQHDALKGLDAISPLHVPDAHRAHWTAGVIALVAHPAMAASTHEYIVHFLVYSGYVIGH
jgi:hypothetical protein